MTEEEFEKLKEEAIRRYPIGCIIKDFIDDKMIILNHDFHRIGSYFAVSVESARHLENNKSDSAFLYRFKSKEWASVISYPKVDFNIFF